MLSENLIDKIEIDLMSAVVMEDRGFRVYNVFKEISIECISDAMLWTFVKISKDSLMVEQLLEAMSRFKRHEINQECHNTFRHIAKECIELYRNEKIIELSLQVIEECNYKEDKDSLQNLFTGIGWLDSYKERVVDELATNGI